MLERSPDSIVGPARLRCRCGNHWLSAEAPENLVFVEVLVFVRRGMWSHRQWRCTFHPREELSGAKRAIAEWEP